MFERREPALVGPVPHVAVELGGHHDLLPPSAALGEPAADDLLGGAPALGAPVDVGRVEEVDPGLEGRVHDGERGGLVGLGPEVHGAEAEAADGEAGPAEVGEAHAAEPTGPARAARRDEVRRTRSGEVAARGRRASTGGRRRSPVIRGPTGRANTLF